MGNDCEHVHTNVGQAVDIEDCYRVYCADCSKVIGPYNFTTRHDALNAEQMFWLGKGKVK